MRLPGTRYQEPGWEQVRKLLGQCSLQAFSRCDAGLLAHDRDRAASLSEYVDLAAEALHAVSGSSRAQAAGNSYGETVFELALGLLFELRARPADWAGFCTAVVGDFRKLGPFWLDSGGEPLLRKKVNDMYAVLRDKVDSDSYQAACGRDCSPNRMYAYRMLDTSRAEIVRLFGDWRAHRQLLAAILQRPLDAEPIEARQLRNGEPCRAEWVIRWSESLERLTGSPGPLHTRSKRFANLRNSPERIEAMLREIADYEALSSNRDTDFLADGVEAAAWMDDYWRVLAESEATAAPGPDQILEAREDEFANDDTVLPPGAGDLPPLEPDLAVAVPASGLSLPPRYIEMAWSAQESSAWSVRMMANDSMPVRLAVYLKLLGPFDDSYPAEWLDPRTGELPTMQQLAALDRISLPTLRKRRDAAIENLSAQQPARRMT